MGQIRVAGGDRHTSDCDGWCDHSYAGWLVSAAPDVLWYSVQDVGQWQGEIYAVGKYRGQILLYADSYGSCSGCGAWGEGGEPANQKEVLAHSKLFSGGALKYASEHWRDKLEDWEDKPDFEKVAAAIQEAEGEG